MKLKEILEQYNELNNTISVELWDPADETGETYVEVPVELDFETTPDEYEGTNLFARGGIDINDLLLAKSFEFKGKPYKAWTSFPPELVPYIEGGKFKSYQDFLNYVENLISKEVEIPSRNYPSDY